GTHLITLDSSCPFYAEGGGQPSDHGTVDGLEVLHVSNSDSDAGGVVVRVAQSITAGTRVACEVDWTRRFDFMQQHTGQHLLSAVVERMFGAETVRWELGREVVEVDVATTPDITADNFCDLESAINNEIRAGRKVSSELVNARSLGSVPFKRGLPKGAALNLAELRVVIIEGLDANPCGGTHVKNLAELQMLKIVGIEKDRGSTRLRFIAGGRVLHSLDVCLRNEARLVSLLALPRGGHADAVDKLLKEKRAAVKERKMWSNELAVLAAKELMPDCSVVVKHISGGEPHFLMAVGDNSVPVPHIPGIDSALSYKNQGDTKMAHSGVFVFVGTPDIVSTRKNEILQLLHARGGGRPGKLQGTFNR
ncbi:unnamed protein product, partial [Ectocarpus fasciculatus]